MSCCFPIKNKRQRHLDVTTAVPASNGDDPTSGFIIRGDVVLPSTEPSTPKGQNGLRHEDPSVDRAGSANVDEVDAPKTEASVIHVAVDDLSDLRPLRGGSETESLARIRTNVSKLLGIPARCVDVHPADNANGVNVVLVPRPYSHGWERNKGKSVETEGWIDVSQMAQRLLVMIKEGSEELDPVLKSSKAATYIAYDDDTSVSEEMNELFRKMQSSWPQQQESRTTTETSSINGLIHTPKSSSGFTYKSPSPMLPPRYLGIGPLEYSHDHSIPGVSVLTSDVNGHATSVPAKESQPALPKLPLKLISEQKTPGTPDERKRSFLQYKPMTPRTERRKHMQGSSVALRGHHARSQLRTDAAAGWTNSPVTVATSSWHEGGERSEDQTEVHRANGESIEGYNQFSQWISPKGKDSSSMLKTPPKPQRGTWVASSAATSQTMYDDSKQAVFSNAEYGVTAMRGTAGWRRQLELAATRVSTSRDPSPTHGRSPSGRTSPSMMAWMDPSVGMESSLSAWMQPGLPPTSLLPLDGDEREDTVDPESTTCVYPVPPLLPGSQPEDATARPPAVRSFQW